MRPEAPHALPADHPPDSGEQLVAIATSGLLASDDRHGIDVEDLFRLPPLPNWCFQRDPQVVLGTGVVFSAMATAARWREGLLTRCLFRYHPELADTPVVFDPLSEAREGGQFFGPHRPRLEGGDMLVLSEDIVAIGVSERTNMVAIELLAEALAEREPGPRWLELVHVPARRAYMHLDTVFTPVDRDAALVFEPVICGDGRHLARTYEIDLRSRDLSPRECGSLLEALVKRGLDLRPIPCGGEDPVAQQREQWTDGANAFALAPGVIVLYDRNVATADALDRAGFRVLAAKDVLLGREGLLLEDQERVCMLMESHEMSRARGGPHCLTHPLVRDEI
jgi:arginine deiminase